MRRGVLGSAVLGVFLLYSVAVCAGGAIAPEVGNRSVVLPARLMFGDEVLREIYEQTGVSYAYPSGALTRQLDVSGFQGRARISDLMGRLAPAAFTVDGVLVLEAQLEESRLQELSQQLRSSDPTVRRAAAYQLGSSKSTKALPLLFAALEDRDESVRHHVLRALDRIERDYQNYHPLGRLSVFRVAKELPVEKLAAFVDGASDPQTHEGVWAVGLIARSGRKVATEQIEKARGHGYISVRRVAEWAASEIAGGRERRMVLRKPDFNAERLVDAYARQSDPWQRAEVLLELGRCGGKTAWDLLLRELGSAEPVVHQAAIRGLARCPEERAIQPLMDILAGADRDAEERNLAGITLGLIGGDKVVAALMQYVNETDKPVSIVGLALGYVMDRRAVPALIKCAKSDSDSLKGYAFISLARYGTREAVDTLAGVYNQYDNTSRYQGHAAIRLAGAWSQEAVDRFVEVVRRGGKIAAHGLEMAEDPRAVDALIEALPQSRGERRQWIIESLGRIGDPKAIPALVTVMNSAPSADEQYQAIRALRWRWFWPRSDVQEAVRAHPVFKVFLQPPPTLEEQEENTWVLRLWPVDLDDDRVCATSYEAGLEFDETTGKVFKWGSHGGRCDAPQTGDTWLYDPVKNIWTESRSSIHPFGMCGTWGTAYHRAGRKIVSVQAEGANHGWQWSRARSMRPSSPWVYDSARDQWVPMKRNDPEYGPGLRGFHQLVYHDATEMVFLFGGQSGNFNRGPDADRPWVYDLYANEWTMLPLSEPTPGARAHRPMCYFPTLNRILLVGGKNDRKTWWFHLEQNRWEEAKARGDIPQFRIPMLYDPVTDSALQFTVEATGTQLWQYDPRANEWRRLPNAPEPTPHHGSVDVAYDSTHNLYVLDGGHLNWNTDHIAVREVWTYRFKKKRPAPRPERLDPPQELRAVVEIDGSTVRLFWQPVTDAAGYHVYRGTGPTPWQVAFSRCTEKQIETTTFRDASPAAAKGQLLYYYVVALDRSGREGKRSFIARTQPPVVEGVVVSTLKDRTVRVRWDPSAAEDVVGYHIYCSSVEIGEMHPWKLYRKVYPLKRLTATPVTETEFHDTRKLEITQALFNHEVRAYEIRAVNRAGIESGSSATVINLTSDVRRVRAEEQPDGTTLVTWEPSPEKEILGYRIYRMDAYRPSLAIQLNPVPCRETRYVDRPETPRGERRKYYVVAVDALGQEGIPSSGYFSFGRP
ncbi:MAG: HEAT repeat domain-containing protein [Kiritimatiellia bacterium]